jgi:hypothetical protein
VRVVSVRECGVGRDVKERVVGGLVARAGEGRVCSVFRRSGQINFRALNSTSSPSIKAIRSTVGRRRRHLVVNVSPRMIVSVPSRLLENKKEEKESQIHQHRSCGNGRRKTKRSRSDKPAGDHNVVRRVWPLKSFQQLDARVAIHLPKCKT